MYKEKKTDFKSNKEADEAIKEIDKICKNPKSTKAYDSADDLFNNILK